MIDTDPTGDDFPVFTVLDADKEVLVTVMRQGDIVYGETYSPSRTARVMWQAFSHLCKHEVDVYVLKKVAEILISISEEIKKRSEIAKLEGKLHDEMAFLQAVLMLKECAIHILEESGDD